MMDLRQTSEYSRYMNSIGWEVKKIKGIYIFLKNILFIGKIAKIQRVNLDEKLLDKIINEENVFYLIYEPIKSTNYKYLQLNKSPYLPSKTIHIDLNKSESEILSKMHQKTRYNIRVALKNEIKIERSNNIDEFASFWSENVERKSINFWSQKKNIVNLYKSFGKNIDLLIAKKDKQIVAGILMPHTENTSYYMYAAANKRGKNLHAPTLITWEAIKLAKKRKKKVFDFEGIYDERFPLKSWLGFSKFKKNFGGAEIEYPGCFTKIYWKNIFK